MTIVNISFILDILKELITGYFNKGLIVIDHELIAKRYLKKLFIFDLLSIIPFLSSVFEFSDEFTFAFDFFIFLKVLCFY
jgi:hypothetical protein